MNGEQKKAEALVNRFVGVPLSWGVYGAWMGCRAVRNLALKGVAKGKEWWAKRKARKQAVGA